MPKYNELYTNERFVCYFDLLGIKRVLTSPSNIYLVYDKYSTTIENVQSLLDVELNNYIEVIWFSDSFVFITKDDSDKSFLFIEQLARFFFTDCIRSAIPIRGAIDYGEMYYDKANNICFGMPLVNAYKYGEGQNWIGLICTDKVVNKVKTFFDFTNRSFHYLLYKIPVKGSFKKYKCNEMYVYDFFECNKEIVMILKGLAADIKDHKVSVKYKNTLNFIEKAKET